MPRAGDRKTQILQLIATMLESPKGEKITTAAMAARLDVSEAALYRHFASKAQMFEGLIEFIESSIFSLINRITGEESEGLKQVHAIAVMLLGFAGQNPGMTRVLIGDALVGENERLQARINALVERIEAALKQSLRIAQTQGALPDALDVSAQANALICYVIGRWHQYAKSGFKKNPAEGLERQLPLLLG
ncbi:nucleoid occlusion factor SlmA [Zoogloea sp.]|uniref:nucleoid occlusion factor SlmA n=1 Tax=Zoogloea sp. TaxID=49181 RepID=UPI001A3E3B67|nr:nucleoid occlusion factor SlmA [Burkholderiales bacterium]